MDAPDKVPVHISLIDSEISRTPGTPSPSRLPPKLVENVRLLWSHRKLFRRVTLYALATTILLAFVIPKRYEATTQLMPPENVSSEAMALLGTLGARGSESPGIVGSVGGAAMGGVASDLLGMKNTGALFVTILYSRTVSDRLIEQFQLQRVYHTKLMEDARTALWERVDMSADRKSGVIGITVTDRDPRRAAAMAQAYVSELNRLVAEVSTSAARRERIFLEDRLKTVKAALDNASQRFSQFASSNNAIDVPAQGKAMVEAAAWLQGQLIFEESQLRGLERIYAPGNVRLQAQQARVAELKKQLDKLGEGDPASDGKSDHSPYPSIRKLPLLGATYFDLYRESKIQETLYQLLTQQYELAKVEEAKQIPSVKVLDVAVVPTKKSYPPRTMIVVSGTLLSLAVTAMWIFVRRWWSRILPDDPGRELAEEMGESFRAGARHLVPLGPALRWTSMRLKRREEPISLGTPDGDGSKEKAEAGVTDVPLRGLDVNG
jgi:capsule polysaccharide export protein KpsE/RkpR